MFSLPRLGPTVRSSTMSTGAASAPARSNSARFRASSALSSPVIWKRLPSRSRIVATLMTSSTFRLVVTFCPLISLVSVLFSMNTTAIGLPMFTALTSAIRLAPTLFSVT